MFFSYPLTILGRMFVPALCWPTIDLHCLLRSSAHDQLVTTELAHKQMGVSGALGFQCTARPSALTASQSFPPSENVDSNLQARDDRSHAPKAARTSAQPGRSKAMKR